jgi:hypothetical protein
VFYRNDLINQLQHNHALVTLVAENLSAYMETMRQFSKGTWHSGFDFLINQNCLILDFQTSSEILHWVYKTLGAPS